MVQSQSNKTKKRKRYNRRTRKYKKTKGGASNEDMQNVNISQPTIATSLDTINNTQLPTQTQDIQEQPVQQPVQQKTKKGKRKKANKKKKTGEPCINDNDYRLIYSVRLFFSPVHFLSVGVYEFLRG